MDDVLGGLGSLSGSGHVKRALGQRVQAPRRANPASGHAGRRWATSSPHPLRTPWEACPVAGAPRARPGPRPGPSSGGHSSPSQPRPRSRPDLADRSVNRPRPRSRPLPPRRAPSAPPPEAAARPPPPRPSRPQVPSKAPPRRRGPHVDAARRRRPQRAAEAQRWAARPPAAGASVSGTRVPGGAGRRRRGRRGGVGARGGGDSARAQLPCSAGGTGGARKGRLSRAGAAAAQSRGGRSDVRELCPGRRARGAPSREGLKAMLGGASSLLARPEPSGGQRRGAGPGRGAASEALGAAGARRGGEMPGSGDWLRGRGRGWDPAAAGGTVVPRPRPHLRGARKQFSGVQENAQDHGRADSFF